MFGFGKDNRRRQGSARAAALGERAEDRLAPLGRAHREALKFLMGVRQGPADARIDQAAARDRLDTTLPEDGMAGDKVIAGLAEAAEGGIVPTMGGRFFGFVVGGAHPVGVAADWLAAAWDDAPGTPLAAPFGCAVDAVAGEWALELLDLPRTASVGLVTGATMANFVGVCAARHALLKTAGWDVEANGLFGAPDVRVILSEDAHPTMRQALRMAGFGEKRVAGVACDRNGAMNADDFHEVLMASDGPTLVCTQLGHVNTGACDSLTEIVPAAKEAGAWVHVDGAFGLWARAGETTRAAARGAEGADSWAVDAHKWLNTPYDGAFAIVRDREAHAASMSVSASYLPQPPGARDPSHFVPELSRRARGHAIYATIRHLGRKGIEEAIDRCCAHARAMRDEVTAVNGISCVNDVVLNQALLRCDVPSGDPAEGDQLTAAVALDVRESGEAWIQSASWRGRTVIRFSVTDHSTTEADISRAAAAITAAHQRRRQKKAA